MAVNTGNNEFRLVATVEAVDYLREIAGAMTEQFGIGTDEAVGRIGQFWHREAFVTQHALIALFHRSPDGWAKHIYYGGKPWWLPGPPPDPAPYQRPVRRPEPDPGPGAASR